MFWFKIPLLLAPRVAPQGDTGGANPSLQRLPRRQLPSPPLPPALTAVAVGPAIEDGLGWRCVGDACRGCWGRFRRRIDSLRPGRRPCVRVAAEVCPRCAPVWGLGTAGAGFAASPPIWPWSAAAGEGPALLCYYPPHCQPCSGVGLDVADAAGCLEPEQSAGGFMASDFSVPSGGVGACQCARIMEVVLGFRFVSR
jgi:hypothetical protein